MRVHAVAVVSTALAAFAAAAVAFGGTASAAQAASSAPPSCGVGDVSASAASTAPVVVSPGTPDIETVTLRNATSSTLTNLSAIMSVAPPEDTNGSGTPAMAWSLDGGSWHSFSLTWNSPSGSGADWQTPVLYFDATLAPGSTHRLELSASFQRDSASGEYVYDIAYSADPCSMNALGQNLAYSAYFPSAPAAPKPTTATPAAPAEPRQSNEAAPQQQSASSVAARPGTPAATKPSAAESSAAAKPSPTTSPSAVPSPSATTPSATTRVLAGTQETAATSPERTDTSWAWIGGIVVLLAGGGAFVGRRVRRSRGGE